MNYTPECAESQTRLDERREAFFGEIKRYVENFRADDALSREQWEQLDDARRPLARSNSLLASVIRWVRLHPSHNIEVPLLVLISYLSQMRDGVCWISARRMGELFGRGETAMRNALKALEEDGLIHRVDRGAGRMDGYYPAIYRGLIDVAASPSWFVDAFSAAPKRAGRPRKNTPHPRVRTNSSEIPHTPGCGPCENSPHPSQKYPAPRGAPESCRESCSEEKRETPAASPVLAVKKRFTADQLRLSDEAFKRYNEAASRLGFQMVTDRGFSDARRTRLLKRLADIGGIENFNDALMAIEFDRFLMGKKPPKPGREPFRLDIEFLLSTESNSGDVLAKLIDGAGEAREKVRNKWRTVLVSSFVRGTAPTDVPDTLVAELAPGCLRGRDVEEAARLPEEKFVSIPQACFADGEYDRALAIRREHECERAKESKRVADARVREAEREAENRDRRALLEGLGPELRRARSEVVSRYRKRNKRLPPEEQLLAEAREELERPKRIAELFPRPAQVAKKEAAR